jgi:hypothetical protein
VEHRILVPSLVALGLSRFGGYNTVVECFFSWGCGVVLFGLLWLLLRRTLPAGSRGPVLLVQSVLLFSLAQLTTYLWGFQIAWALINVLALVVIVTLSSDSLGPLRYLVALVAALAASLSSAQGIFLLAIGIGMLNVRRPFPVRAAAAWSAATLLALVLILPGLSLAQPANGLAFTSQLTLRIATFPVVLGAAIAGWSGTVGAFAAGVFAVWRFYVASRAYYVLLRSAAPEASAWTPWIALAAFGILGAFMIAIGRGVLGVEYGLQERYVTLSSIAWIGLLPLEVLQFSRSPGFSFGKLRALVPVTVGVLAFSLASEYVSTLPRVLAVHERRLQQLALVRNYTASDDSTLVAELFPNESAREFMRKTHFPSPDDVRGLIEGLDQNHEGPFVGFSSTR